MSFVEYPLYKRIGGVRVLAGVSLVDDWAVEYLDERVRPRVWGMHRSKHNAESLQYARINLTVYKGGKRTTETLMMHTFLLRLVDPEGERQPDGLKRYAEHIDRNSLNNTIANLRWATFTENGANKNKCKRRKGSRYKGVRKEPNCPIRPWVTYIGDTSKPNSYVGHFKTEEEAAMAYNKAAVERYGEFAVLNVIEQEVTK